MKSSTFTPCVLHQSLNRCNWVSVNIGPMPELLALAKASSGVIGVGAILRLVGHVLACLSHHKERRGVG